jgi:FMN phosphatase YigB (HAD superfamily)/glycosyltransferase involved in cell wall biosynthesis
MKVAIVHYHAGPGGVMEVIRSTSRGLAEAGVPHVVLTGGSPVPESHGLPLVTVAGLEYGAVGPAAADLLESLRVAASAALGAAPDIWHFHNHPLGKNQTLHGLVALLAARNEHLLLHIHDLAEDGRPENAWQFADRKHLYPSGPHVHYAFLNSRDRNCFLDAGLIGTRAHLLPNPIQRQPLTPALPGAPPLLLYPVRGIRRKNLGEFLLLSALAPEGTRGAVTRAPLNPAAIPVHDGWRRFARECGIAVEFDVADRLDPVTSDTTMAGTVLRNGPENEMSPNESPRGRNIVPSAVIRQPFSRTARRSVPAIADRLSFETWCHHATHFVTTSVAEGFGMAFLESIARGKPLLGRNLPHLAADHASQGIRFAGLYDRLLIPAAWVDPGILKSTLQEAATGLWSAWRREPPAIASIHALLERGEFLDFGNLPEVLQQRVITKLMDPAMKSLPLVEHGGTTQPAADWLAQALRLPSPPATLPEACDPAVYLRNLTAIYQKISAGTGDHAGRIDPGIILDRCLTPGRVQLLNTPPPARRPPPDFHTFRAIIFDIYGTLLSGRAGAVKADAAADPALREIIARLGHQPPQSPSSVLHAAVLRQHAASGMTHPEIDLRAPWREVLSLPPTADTTALVIETEAAWHPARLMPGAAETLRALAAAGVPLGLLSNAQCNTLTSLGELSSIFAEDLVILSYRHGVAKPSPILFDLLAARLADRGITPQESLYIGNDPLHDIEPAAARGFTTALFTGQPDSLRAGACFPDYEIRSWSE